jgi:RHS repeat-associated protein
VSSPADDLDYMHARHYSPITGRFLSVDRVGGRTAMPQTWNRYAYSLGNPLKFVDPNGDSPVPYWSWGQWVARYFGAADKHGGVPHYHVYDKGGRRLVGRIDMQGRPMKGNPGRIPNSVLKKMVSGGLFAGILMFFEASPAYAPDLRVGLIGDRDRETLEGIALEMFGPVDLMKLEIDKLLDLLDEHDQRQEEEERDRMNAEESLRSLTGASCLHTGVCLQQPL